MNKLRVGAAAVVLLAVAAVIIQQQQRADHLVRENATLREQVEQATSLQDQNQRLVEQLKSAAERSQAEARELARLRGQAGTMRQMEQENVRLKAERERLAKQPTQTETEEGPYDRLFGQGGNARIHHAMRWGTALYNYASQHQGRFPASFQEAVPFFDEDLSAEDKAQTALTVDRYEILYHGRREDMTNPPPEGAILIREKQPWQTTQGTWARTYIYGDSVGTIRTEPDGNFDKWESVRIPKNNVR